MIPAIKALYKDKEEQSAALKRHLEFYNTHPYVSAPIVSTVTQAEGAYIDWASLPAGAEGIKVALEQYSSLGAAGLNVEKVTTLQGNLDQLIPGLAAVCLTLLCCQLLKKNVSPITIILALFAVGIIGCVLGFM